MEEWRDCVGYEGLYEVSNIGRVKRVKQSKGTRAGKILRPGLNKYGYPLVALCIDGVHHSELTYHLVADAFIGPRPEGHDINHINGIKTDATVGNLEYVTRGQNHLHAYRTGLRKRPTRIGPGPGPDNRPLHIVGIGDLTPESSAAIRVEARRRHRSVQSIGNQMIEAALVHATGNRFAKTS